MKYRIIAPIIFILGVLLIAFLLNEESGTTTPTTPVQQPQQPTQPAQPKPADPFSNLKIPS